MKTNFHKIGKKISAALAWLLLLGVLPSVATSCNEKDDDKKEQEQTTAYINSVAITKFSLQANNQVMSGLDSVFFSIDLKNGVIFNADSLPKGTDVKALATKIQFYNTISEAVYTMENGSHRTGKSDYREAPNDTIDFTGDVTLHVVSGNGEYSMDYKIKVNVHKEDPDSLAWSETSVAPLPARLNNPQAQKTVRFGNGAVCMVKESDGSFTLSKIAEEENAWTRSALSLPFAPDVRSLAASADALYILATDGSLYSSADGSAWTATGEQWLSLLGGYDKFVLGLRLSGGALLHTHYPASAELADGAAAEDFPVKGYSELQSISNPWAPLPTAILVGGRDRSGNLSSSTWAFDGKSWARLSEALPPIEGCVLFPYFAFRRLSSSWALTERSVWMVISGKTTDGYNRQAYISYDNGVSWRKGSQHLDLPQFIPSLTDADCMVMATPMSGTLAGWKIAGRGKMPAGARVKYHTDGDDIYWDCPYIYLIGGVSPENALSNAIWRGALNRLTFTPLI